MPIKKISGNILRQQCFGLTVYADADSDSYGDAANSYFAPDWSSDRLFN